MANGTGSPDYAGTTAATVYSKLTSLQEYTATATNGTCTSTSKVTVSPFALPTISGNLTPCLTGSSQLIGSGSPDATTPWTSSDTNVATVSTSGLVSALTTGSTTITYKNSNGCSITATVTIIALPTISGSATVCVGGTTILSGSGTAATTPWTSASTGIATISTNGTVSGIAAGSSVITYTNSIGCSVTRTQTAQDFATAPVIITSPINAGSFAINGTSVEADGSIISVYRGATLAGTATVSSGGWSYTFSSALVGGNVITATVIATGKCASVPSTGVTVLDYTATPVVTSPLCQGATTVNGTSSEADGTTISVYLNASLNGTTTVSSGAWSYTLASAATLNGGNTVTATAAASGKTLSLLSSAVTTYYSLTMLSYSSATSSYPTGVAISTNTATATPAGAGPITYTVSPIILLPTGLSINSATGAITGTPTVATAATTYTIIATSACNVVTTDISIATTDGVSGLSYTTPVVYCDGVAITNNNPSITGTTTGYSVSPALPSGLSLDTTTGTISGTPSGASSPAVYTVTATSASNSITFDITISVNVALSNLTYSTASATYCTGSAITPITKTITGNGTITYSVSPSLPTGLSLNGTSGTISGTPTAATAAADYTITATNVCFSTTAVVNIGVNTTVSGLSYTTASVEYCSGVAISANSPSLTGTGTLTYSVSALPDGLSLDTATGIITGTPTTAAARANFTVSVTNGCSSTTTVLNIGVNGGLSGFAYATSTATYCSGSAITPNTASITGTGTVVYSVSPSLPTGLGLNTATGTISGTPTVATAAADYTVTAINGCNSTTAIVNITINTPLSALNYTTTTVSYCTGAAITANNATITGTGATYTVSPALPLGFSLNGSTGAITGTPTVATAAANYTVTASNGCSTAIKVLNITVTPSLGGPYTVGSGQNYATLTAAVAAYNAATCFSGNVVFNLMDTTYSTAETFPITITANANAGTKTLTIKPNTTATITGATTTSILKLNGADYIIIDGSNAGSTDRSLTISNTATATPTAIALASLGTAAGATNNTIKNCNITTGAATTSGYGISVSGSTAGSNGADNDNVTIQNNTISGAPIGIYAIGTAAVSAGGLDNLAINGNTVDATTTLTGNYGIKVGNALTSTVNKNTVSVQSSASTQPVAISLETGFVSSTVNGNNITKALATSTGGYGGRGITVGTGNATSALTISNNFINGVNGSNYSGFTNSSSAGILIGAIGNSGSLTNATGGVNLYYNTVTMSGSMGSGSTTAITTALYVGSGAATLNIRNNIFSNTQVATSTTQKNYAIYSAVSNTAFTAIDYNDYYVSNTFNAASAVLGFLTSDATTFAALKTALGSNVNSLNTVPNFVSTTDSHLNVGTNTALDNKGILIAGITTDYDGDTRSGSTPDMGADEFTTVTCATGLAGGTISSTIPSFCGTTTGATISATGYSVGVGTTYQWESSTTSTTTGFTGIGTASAIYANLSTGALSATTYYRLNVTCTTSSTTVYSTNVLTITKFTPAVTTVSSSVAICATQTTTLTAGGSSTYAWTPSTGLSNYSTNGSSVDAAPSATTTYTVTGTDANGCTTSAPVTVTVTSNPGAITVTKGASQICVNSVMSLTSSGGLINTNYINESFTGTSFPGWLVSATTANGDGVGYTSTNVAGGTANEIIFAGSTSSSASSSTDRFYYGPFNSSGNTTLALSWKNKLSHYSSSYAYGVSVQTSTDGINWHDTTWITNPVTADMAASTQSLTVNTTDVGSSTLYVSFTLRGLTWGINNWWIDDVLLTGTSSAPITWSPTTNLYTTNNAASGSEYTGTNLAVVYVKPSSSTPVVYTASVSNGSCTTTGTTTVTANSLPVFSLNGTSICSGGSATLTPTATVGTAPYTYAWTSTPSGFTDGNVSSITVSPTSTTAYNVTATDANGCSTASAASATVTVNTPATITASSAVTICTGQSTNLTVSGAVSYTWTPTPASTSNGGATVTVSPTSTTTYTVTGVDANGCTTGSKTVLVTVLDQLASITASAPNYCYGSTSLALSTTSAATANTGTVSYSWTGPNGFTASTQNATVTNPSGGGTYTVTATNGYCSTTSSISVTEYALPTVTSSGATICRGTSTTLTASGASTYTWSPSTGLSNFGTNGSSVTAAPTATQEYKVTGTDANGCVSFAMVTVTVTNPGAILTIGTTTLQTVSQGQQAEFHVATASGPSYTYQWQVSTDGGSTWNNVSNDFVANPPSGNYTGVTTNTLLVDNIDGSYDGYRYQCIVTGDAPCASLTPTVATLTVSDTGYAQQPQSSTICSTATSTTFTVVTSGTEPYGLGWQMSTDGGTTFNDIADATTDVATGLSFAIVETIDGAFNHTLVLTVTGITQSSNGIQFQALVNYYLPSNPATLNVIPAIVVASTTGSHTICSGTNDSFTVTASNVASYQWQVNTGFGFSPISGATSATLTLNTVPFSSNGNIYNCVITGNAPCSAVTTGNATLTVNDAVAISASPASATLCTNGSNTFSVSATGTGIAYQWQVSTNGTTWNDIATETASSYSVTNVTSSMSGTQYRVVISGTAPCSAVTSGVATLTVNSPVDITNQPSSATFCSGTTASFTIVASNAASYQWQVDTGSGFSPISGATSATLTLSNVSYAANGYTYNCIVNGLTSCTNRTSDTVSLTVTPAVAISVSPSSLTVCAGSDATFSVTATNVASYQWEMSTNGTTWNTIADATASSYTATAVSASMNGTQYHVVLSGNGLCSAVTSGVATLTVKTPALITTHPANQTVCASGGTATFNAAASGTGVTYQWQFSTNGGSSWANYTGTGATTTSISILNPALATNGTKYQMLATVGSPCSNVDTSTAATLYINNPTITSNPAAATVIAGNTATYTVAASAATSYQWRRSTTLTGIYTPVVNETPTGVTYSGDTTPTLSVITSSTTATGSANFYQCVVTNTLSGTSCTATSTGGQMTVTNYCTSIPSSTSDEEIYNVTVNGSPTNAAYAGSTNGCATVAPGPGSILKRYSNFTTLGSLASLTLNQVVPFSVAENECDGATYYYNGAAIWIDYNQDGDFLDSGEQVYVESTTTISPRTIAGNFTIPSTATLGTTRMRIIVAEGFSGTGLTPCMTYSFGETEDYLVTIVAAPACTTTTLVAGTASAASTSFCAGSGTTLSLTGTTNGYTGISYQWYYSANGIAGSYSAVSGATAATLATGALTANAYYKCNVSCSGGSSLDTDPVAITVTNPLITGTTPIGRCGAGTVSLVAAANAGSTINWYAAATGGSSLATGTSYTTPSISATTTYYVSASGSDPAFTPATGYCASTSTGTYYSITGFSTTGGTSNISNTGTSLSASGYGDYSSTKIVTANSGSTVSFSVSLNTDFDFDSYGVALWVDWNNNGTFDTGENVYNSATYVYSASSSFVIPTTVASGTYRMRLRADYNLTSPVACGVITQGETEDYSITVVRRLCETSRTAVIATVTPQPTATINYTTPICSTAGSVSVTLTGTNAYTGGTFTSSPTGLSINATTGAIDVAVSTPGTYTVSYATPGSANCNPVIATKTITISQALTSGFTYSAATYCTTAGAVIPEVTGTAGTFTSSPTGLNINATTGAINTAASAAGTYTVTNTVTVAGCSNSTTTASVTIHTAVAVTTNPISQSVLVDATNTIFTVAATGTGLTYLWEVNQGSGWVSLASSTYASEYSSATAATLTVANAHAEMDQYQFHCVVSGTGTCASATSTAATLTVRTAAIATQPVNATACSSGVNTASFTVATTGTVTSSQWQFSTNNGTSWLDVNSTNWTSTSSYSNETTTTLSLAGLGIADNGLQFRVKLNGNDVTSNAATLTVKTMVSTTDPVATTGCSGGTASFTVVASGTSPTYQWQVSTNGTTYNNVTGNASATTDTLALTGLTVSMNGYQYQVIVSGASPCGSVTSNFATLTVNTAVAITTPPASAPVCSGANATISVVATGTGLGYQWQSSTNGTSWSDVSGATSASYTITGFTTTTQYRVVVSGATACSSVTSSAATLTVNQPVAPVFTPASADICSESIQALTVSSSSLIQNGVIGTGTVSNTNGPFKGYFGGHKVQYLYTAAELTALGYTNGTVINSLGMDITAFSSPFTFNAFTIGMKNTSTTVLTTTIETGMTTVKNSSNYVLSGTVPFTVTLPLDTSFTWNGTSNVLVEFCYNNNNAGGISANSANVKSSTTTTVLTHYFTADSNATVCSAPGTATTSTVRANMRFGVVSGTLTWSPIAGLYTNTGATTAYVSGNASTLYAKPTSSTTYTVTATNSLGCTNTSTVAVNVATPSTLSSITQPAITCSGAQTTFVLAGLLPNSTSTLSYNINGATTQTITGVIADASGASSFTLALAGFTNGQTLTVTAIQRTDLTPNCTTTISANNTVGIQVRPLVTYYADADGDTYGNASVTSITCQVQPLGYVTNNTDCDDTNPLRHATFSFYADNDGDGYGAGALLTGICAENATTPPTGYSLNSSDCDDTNASSYQTTHSTTATACNTYTWASPGNGTTYTTGGTYTYTTSNAAGCTNIETLVLTINNSTTGTTTATACNSYVWATPLGNGTTYTAGGTYTNSSTNAAGCNHVETLVLTINSSSAHTTTETACDSYMWATPLGTGTTYSASGTYTNSSTNASGCNHTETLVLTINNSTSSVETVTSPTCGTYTWAVNSVTYTSSGTYTVTGTNAAGCVDTKTLVLTINPCQSVVTVKMNIEGYYDTAAHAMRPVMANQGVGSSATDVDTVTIELHNATAPYAIVDTATAVLQTNGNAVATFSSAPVGSFYIAIKHRNSVETWSATAQSVGATPLTYDFTDSASKAYGSNMILVDGKYAIYNGDINQDGFIESGDYPSLFNDSDAGLEGFYATDLNGDGFVESGDYPILFNNSDSGIESVHP